jgi:Tol biopolymer transport system component
MVRPDRYVKVLDFGLAKLTERPIVSSLSEASTADGVVTDPGTVMGTTRYMSPEQARGLDVDARSDIFNLGIVLYEMLAGSVPFTGDTPADVVASILRTDPQPLGDSAAELPADLERIVSKALRKDKAERFETSEQILTELEAVKARMEFEVQLDRSEHPRPAPPRPTLLQTLSESRTILAVVALLVVTIVAWKTSLKPERDSLASFDNPEILTAWRSSPWSNSIDYRSSPDTKMIAYSSAQNEMKEAIFVKQVGVDNEIQLTGYEWRDVSLVWSPDSQQLAFAAARERQVGIYQCPFLGGTRTLLKMFDETSGNISLKHWSKDGSIFYEVDANLFRLDVASRQTSQITNFPSSRLAGDIKDFCISPNEDLIAYRDRKDGQADLWVMAIVGGNPVRLTNDPEDDSHPCWHPDGKRIFYNTSRRGHSHINLAYSDGRKPVQVTRGEGDYRLMDVTSNGPNDSTKIIYSSATDESDIMRVRVDAREDVEVASALESEFWADVSPDGNTIAFQTNSAPRVNKAMYSSNIVVKSSSNAPQTLAVNGYDPRWLPDGQRVLFLRSAATGRLPNLWTVSTLGNDEKQITDNGVLLDKYFDMPFNRVQTRDFSVSPDGRQVAYCSVTSGLWNLWTTSIDGSGERTLSNNSDPHLRLVCPLWSPDGNRIAYTWWFDAATADGRRVCYVSSGG